MTSKNLLIVALFFFLNSAVDAQNELSLNFTTHLWESNLTNPALLPDGKKIIISLPSTYYSAISPVSLGKFIVTRNERRVLDLWSKGWIDHLQEYNVAEFNNQFLSGAISIPIGKYFRISGHHLIATNETAEFTRDAVSLIYKGNAQYIGRTANLFNINNFDMRSEFGLGITYSKDNFTFGARLKSQNGIAGAFTRNSTLNLYTDTDHYGLGLNTDYKLQTFEPGSDLKRLFTNNGGHSFDVGFKMRSDNLELTGSMIDLGGRVNWKHNSKSYSTKGQYDFYGFSTFKPENATFKSIADSLKNALNIKTTTGDTYQQPLNLRIYASANYILTDNLRIGVAFLIDDKPYGAEVGAMTYVRTKLWNFWDVGLSAGTRSGGKRYDLGLQSTVTLFDKVQLYFVTDNIVTYISPTTAKTINGRLGINLMFGKDENLVVKEAKDKSGKKKSIKKKKIKLKLKPYWYKKKKR